MARISPEAFDRVLGYWGDRLLPVVPTISKPPTTTPVRRELSPLSEEAFPPPPQGDTRTRTGVRPRLGTGDHRHQTIVR